MKNYKEDIEKEFEKRGIKVYTQISPFYTMYRITPKRIIETKKKIKEPIILYYTDGEIEKDGIRQLVLKSIEEYRKGGIL